MATPMRNLPPIQVSFSQLSPELVALVFEQLRDIDLKSLRSIRLVSRRFEAIAAPISYHILTLNKRILAPDAELLFPDAFQRINRHTNHVNISSDLDPQGITRVVLRIQRLASIRWLYIGDSFKTSDIWVPSDFLNSNQTRFKNTKLLVENLPLQEFEGHLHNFYLRAIPAKFLTSLKLKAPSPALTARLGSMKELLLQSPSLQTFEYEDRGLGTSFTFQHGERMPAVTNLKMRSYSWNHTREQVEEHWNFSNIESLELVAVPLYNFLSSVRFDNFRKLHTLHAEDYSAHLPDKRQESTGGLYLLIKNHIQALKRLDITCHVQIFPLDAILAHSDSLTTLRFRDHTGFCDDDKRCPTLWAGDVALLAEHLKHVQTMELDMDAMLCDPIQFLRAVCDFSALHTVTLNVQTTVNPFEAVRAGVDRDGEAALQTFQFLVQMKQQMTPPGSWKNITIKVGGWKPIMVRRLGSEWREHNANGIFAERCFVLEKGEGGVYDVREEMGFERTSRRNTPTPDP